MSEKISIVRQYLSNLPSLTVVTLDSVFQELVIKYPRKFDNTKNEKAYLSAMLQRLSIGSKRVDKLTKFFAIFLEIDELKGIGNNSVYLSLKGIEKTDLEGMDKVKIKKIKTTLSRKYGIEVIKFWIQKTQYNCIPRIRTNETKCKICERVEQTFKENGKIPTQYLHLDLKNCHIISRNSVFWKKLMELHEKDEKFNLFDDSGVIAVRNELNNDSHYATTVRLCYKHDEKVQRVISNGI